ncbi:hemolysin family protein [Sedimentisphaera salicampi]|uniref:hemolysin family protein n=1 Tax=Sedimentisphaera salicampi TaxID=1941349 RepID=UPI000B9C5289|nr:hemolysin family protein [Sedimentisphaera salicampi]OXU15990.1 Hemolysin C [Sedimentisphaera salicampi]
MILFITYLFLAIFVSFLCSLLEAALLSVPRSHVALMLENGSRAGRRLEKMKDDVDQPLAAILTLNTFAHTLGAAGVGTQAALLWGEAWVGMVSFILTLVILVFSEIIPKTLGAVHAKELACFTVWTVHGLVLALKPLVAVCNLISKWMGGKQPVPVISREEVSSLAWLAHFKGTLEHNEAKVMRNIIALRNVTVKDVMTPRTVVTTLQENQTVSEVTETEPPRFARIPVVGESLDDVKGLLHRRDLFKARSKERGDKAVSELVRPIHAVPELANLQAVLDEFLRRSEHLFLVVDEYGGAEGIITLEDVLETLLGEEIVDETDAVEDMQALARQLLESKRKKEE